MQDYDTQMAKLEAEKTMHSVRKKVETDKNLPKSPKLAEIGMFRGGSMEQSFAPFFEACFLPSTGAGGMGIHVVCTKVG